VSVAVPHVPRVDNVNCCVPIGDATTHHSAVMFATKLHLVYTERPQQQVLDVIVRSVLTVKDPE
jgi:hypothetical protein